MKNEWSDLSTQIENTQNEVLTPKLTNLVEKYAKGPGLFDYGCGWGDFADFIQKDGFSVTAGRLWLNNGSCICLRSQYCNHVRASLIGHVCQAPI